ncbi:hypothetical protein E3Q15_00224 [Wallemia mellicola]|uniref:Uncharacterized protein n=1 Tax=Wallemia mellicola TaxID=1708541 RepID=A0A4T0Q2L4_9BASI|nr:hypothetical protein E3Q15_00224 [Wallemia mellicola]TIC67065.1 hypothetical protein E3Q01_01469 [Wallemia mellicola]
MAGHSLNITLTVVLTVLAAISIILVTIYLIKYDAPPMLQTSIIVAPAEDEEFYVEDLDDTGGDIDSVRKSVAVNHRNTYNLRPLSTFKSNRESVYKSKPDLSNVRASWIEICNPKVPPKLNDKAKNLRGLPASPRPPSFFPLNIDPNSPGLPTSVRPIAVSPIVEEESSTTSQHDQRNSSYLTVFEDEEFAKKIIDRKSRVMSYAQYPPQQSRMSFVAGDDSKLAKHIREKY